MLTKQQMTALLGRPLTPAEDANFTTYLDNAIETLEGILCSNLDKETAIRIFDAREGYSTVFTDPFTAVNEVKINGNIVTNYSLRQWANRNGSWYNSLVFERQLGNDEVSIDADWGFTTLPQDLALLLARVFALNGESGGDGNIKSKKIEDFSVTFGDKTAFQGFLDDNATTIRKYSLCEIGNVQHGGGC